MSMQDAGASGAMSLINTLMQMALTIARDGLKYTMNVAGQVGRGSLHAAGAMLRNAQERSDRGQVSLNRFTQLAQSREPVHVTDREVAKILRTELKKHGATFAVEKHLDGSMTYHAEGKDATLIAHALEQAEKRVDELNRSRTDALERGETIPAGDEHHIIELSGEQATQLAGELREYSQTLQDSGRADEAAQAEALAEQAEQNHAVPANDESLELIEEARAAHGAEPELMQPVQEAIEDERATIDAEPYHALVDHSIDPEQVMAEPQVIVPLTETQAQQLSAAVREQAQPAADAPAVDVDRAAQMESIAADIEVNASIDLTPETTQILHETFEKQGWLPGADVDQTPRAMRDVVELVEDERTIQQSAPEQEREAPVQEAPAATIDTEQAQTVEPEQVPEQAAPVVDVPTQAAPAVAAPEAVRNSSPDPFGADEWGDDDHDIDEPAHEVTAPEPTQDAPTTTLPPKPTMSAAQAAREAAGKTQQEQPKQAPATTREREGGAKIDRPQKPALGQVVGKIVEGRTQAAKKEAAARQSQRDVGLNPTQQTTPKTPTGPSR